MKKLFFLSVAALMSVIVKADLVVGDLRVEHLETPLGLDAKNPRFTWRMQSDLRGVHQSAYRISVGTDSAAVASGQADMWEFKETSPRVLLRYQGKPLKPQTAYFWQVCITDSEGRVATSGVERFETGMMGIAQWQGAWIADGQNINELRAPYFRKAFSLGKPVRSARLYIAAAGLYELFVNGSRVGDHMLDPLYTRFDRRNLYVTHDVTALLMQGKNAVGVVLGNGWYNHQSLGVWNFETAPWRNRPTFCLDLVITYEDGTRQVVPTDLSWRTGHGEIVFNSIYTGEHRNFTLTQKGWNMPDFDDSKWRGVGYRTAPSQNVVAQQAEPIRVDWERQAVSLRQVNDSTWVYDFGQNMAGVTRLRFRGEAGMVLRIAHAERVKKDGHIDASNIDIYYRGDKQKDPFQTDVITLSGGEDEHLTQFNYKGFRYAQVTADRPLSMTKENLTACFLHSDVESVGEIRASNPIIEKLMHAGRMSYLSNFMGLPTDCPQREKNGWTGDGHLAVEAGLYNFDGITIYEKWMADHRDEQQPNGVLPDIIPTCGWGYGTDNGLDWTSTIAIIPWTLYTFYGDDQALRDCYDNIRRYVNYVERTSRGLLTTWGRGDWVPVSVGSNKEFTSSIYFHEDARILARAAEMFGYEEDARRYGQLARDIRDAINRKYLNRETGVYASGTQTEQSMPLCWGIVPDECRALVAERLNEKVLQSDFHLDVGVLGCRSLLTALCQNGYAETAYRVAIQDTYPSWGWWVQNGATTLLENWKLDVTRDGSDNHMMFGEIAAWFYRDLGGIMPDPQDPGFHHTILRPFFPEKLESFSAKHRSSYGEITSSWTCKGKKVIYNAVVPPNSTATFHVPAGWKTKDKASTLTLSPGSHQVEFQRIR